MTDNQIKKIIIGLFGTIIICCIILVIVFMSKEQKAKKPAGDATIKRSSTYEITEQIDTSYETPATVTDGQDEDGWEDNRVSSNTYIGEETEEPTETTEEEFEEAVAEEYEDAENE